MITASKPKYQAKKTFVSKEQLPLGSRRAGLERAENEEAERLELGSEQPSPKRLE